MNHINRIHSFIKDADTSLFPLEHLPLGVFSHEAFEGRHIGAAIGDRVLDLTALEKAGLIENYAFQTQTLNAFAALSLEKRQKARQKIQALLKKDANILENHPDLEKHFLFYQSATTMHRPFQIGGFTDFYACEQHAAHVGSMFRSKEQPLLPNWKRLPVAYHGRASTVMVSDSPVRRPKGQILLSPEEPPVYEACRKLDFELEMGIFIGQGNTHGERISYAHANNHIFGLVLLNDWSARDVQSFEYQPLGPFLSKSFATSISPWVVMMEALTPFQKAMPDLSVPVVEYLQEPKRHLPDVRLKVELQTQKNPERLLIAEASLDALYWSFEQMIAHHTVNHCILETGDLLGTGTISGPKLENSGSLLEMTENGTQPLLLKNGETRRFLEDGDTVIFSAYCQNEHYSVGFGEVKATILPAFIPN